jgi:hypothetical protein
MQVPMQFRKSSDQPVSLCRHRPLVQYLDPGDVLYGVLWGALERRVLLRMTIERAGPDTAG